MSTLCLLVSVLLLALALAATRKQEPLVAIIQAVEHLTKEELKDATEYLIGERMAREQRK